MKRALTLFLMAALLIASVPALTGSAVAAAELEARAGLRGAVVGIVATFPADASDPTPLKFGTGFVYRKEAVITSAAVVKGAKRVQALLPDGRVVDVNVTNAVSIDGSSQVAVLVSTEFTAEPVVFGPSDYIHVGQQVVVAINPLGVAKHLTEATGVVSGTERYLDSGYSYIQTDAPMGFGGQGAPLANSRGEVIGMIAASIERSDLERLNLAVPASAFVPAADAMVTAKRGKTRPWLGIVVKETRMTEMGIPSTDGLLVTRVFAGGPASGKVFEGSMILRANGTPVRTEADLNRILLGNPSQITLVLRKSEATSREEEVRLVPQPEPETLAQASGIFQRISMQHYNDALDYANDMLEEPYDSFARGYLSDLPGARVLLETEYFRIANATYVEYRRPSVEVKVNTKAILVAGQGKLFVHALIPMQTMTEAELKAYKGDGLPRLVASRSTTQELRIPVPVSVYQGSRKLFEGVAAAGPTASVPLLSAAPPPAPATGWMGLSIGFDAAGLDPRGSITVDLGRFGKVTYNLSDLR